ncbi:MAG: rod shape-determining protein MreD [Pseudomonadales bacterium]|nr:rod shape-determining protein MreD [Pseudomonadales bacterium]
MRAYLAIGISIAIAFCLLIFPMPLWFNWVRPDFLMLVLIYWSMASPEHCGIVIAAAAGLLCDVLTGTLLGQHMLAYALVVAITLVLYKRLRSLDLWHQAWFVFVLAGLAQMLEFWLATFFGRATLGLWFLLPVLIASLIWPGFMIFMRAFRRKMGVVKHWV